MASTQDTYFEAAKENLETAQWLHEQAHYYTSHYFSGLAVECMLRAYLRRITKDFESRHDLYELAKEARFFDIVPRNIQEEYGAKLQELNQRWRSNHRYFSERQVKDYWNSIRADYGTKGDAIKQASRVVFNLADSIVSMGVVKWQQTK